MNNSINSQKYYVRHSDNKWNQMTCAALKTMPIDLDGWASFYGMLIGARKSAVMTVHRTSGQTEIIKVFPWPEGYGLYDLDHSRYEYDSIA